MLAAKNSRKRMPARSPAAATRTGRTWPGVERMDEGSCAISTRVSGLLPPPAPALVAALMVKGTLISDAKPQTPGARYETGERFFLELAFGDSILVDTDRRQKRQSARVAKVKQEIKMTTPPAHLSPCLRPLHAAGLGQFAVARADLL